MTVSVRVMSAGTGYRYLLDSVAVGDGRRQAGQSLAGYYTTAGTPPGFWVGSGVTAFGDGLIRPGDEVAESHLRRLLGSGCDPVTGEPLGRAYPEYRSRAERVAARVASLDADLTAERRAEAVAAIEEEEADRRSRRAVAGFDVTFSAPKSVSVLWALADPDIRQQIITSHHGAVADVVALFEAEVAATRTGVAAADGAVAQVAVDGVAAAAFDHFDSRSGDPQLHTHVVVSNKVRTVLDGKWRSLDGRPVHASLVAMSEYYNTILADRLSVTLGVGWERRERGRDRNAQWEIAGIDDDLLTMFSGRSRDIEVAKGRLVAEYVSRHGHQPSPKTIIRLRQRATLETRPDKTVRSLADLTHEWRDRSTELLDTDLDSWTRQVLGRNTAEVVTAADVPVETVGRLGAAVVSVVGERRATWRHWNLHAEASRQTADVRFATPADRRTVVNLIVEAAEDASVRLTPLDLAPTPPELCRADGTSVLRPRHHTVFTSEGLLAAEDRLVSLGASLTGPTVPGVVVGAILTRGDQDRMLGADQVAAVRAVAGSGRVVDVLVGPAGTGKTTTMGSLRTVWETIHGTGSVVGLAPSAAAAAVLADDLVIATENTAKWLHDHTTGDTTLRQGQLVIIDEASLAGTHTLDRITSHAHRAGAKVLLVGDPAQLGAVDAGGAFNLVATSRTDVATLGDPRRFTEAWEADATLALRAGDLSVVDTYQTHGRIIDGDTPTMLDAAYDAWTADIDAGRQSLLIAATTETVTALNTRAQADRIDAGHVHPAGAVALHDGTQASPGDQVVTRRNNRRLTAGRRWVRNGDRWTVTATSDDGTLTVRGLGGGGQVVLPADYVAAHVELGYATTVHRAQGATVDTAHTIVTGSMARETLYVAMTRGRQANIAYVTTDEPNTEPHHDGDDDGPTGHVVLAGVVGRVGAERSARETIAVEQDRWSGIDQLAAEYETIAAVAEHDRWTQLVRTCGLTDTHAGQVVGSEAFGPLTAALRHAEADGWDPDTLLPRLVESRPVDDADDIAAVLHHRLTTTTNRRSGGIRPRRAPRLIVGFIPAALGPMDDDLRQALDERARLIETRAETLATAALDAREPWTRALGMPPTDPHQRDRWIRNVRTVAAYRDRYHIAAHNPLGPTPTSTAQQRDAARARAAFNHARHLTVPAAGPARTRSAQRAGPSL